MNKVLKSIYGGMLATLMCMGLAACSNEDNELVIEQTVNAEGKWFVISDTYAQMLIIDHDNSVFSTGVNENVVWKSVYGKFGFRR